jgi:hypothetical protein
VFQSLLQAGLDRKIKIHIAQSAPTQSSPNLDTEYLAKRKAAEVRSVNFPRLIGGGVLHTKLWIIDNQHIYLGSANMDWRSLTQVNFLVDFKKKPVVRSSAHKTVQIIGLYFQNNFFCYLMEWRFKTKTETKKLFLVFL